MKHKIFRLSDRSRKQLADLATRYGETETAVIRILIDREHEKEKEAMDKIEALSDYVGSSGFEDEYYNFDAQNMASEILDSQRDYSTEDARADGMSYEEYADGMLDGYEGPERDEVHRWLVMAQENDDE